MSVQYEFFPARGGAIGRSSSDPPQDIGQAVNKVLGVDGCACGHPWDMHGPEAPGCVECECEYIREGVTND